MARVIWSPTSLDDLNAILTYIASDSPANARRFGERILDRIELLADQPESGGFVPEECYTGSREVLVGRYRIIYDIEAEGSAIRILTVIHGARLLR